MNKIFISESINEGGKCFKNYRIFNSNLNLFSPLKIKKNIDISTFSLDA